MTTKTEAQEPKTLVDCGCETKVHKDGSGVEVYMCPLHEAAPELLEALKEAKELIRLFHGDPAWEIYDSSSPEMKRLNAAIAKAIEAEGTRP